MNVQPNSSQDIQLPLEEGDAHASLDRGIQLQDLARIVNTRWRLIAGTIAIIMALTVLVLFQITPLYRGDAVVMLDQRKNNLEDINAVLSGLPTDPTSMQNQAQILTSRNLAGRVIDSLHLDQDEEFNPTHRGLFDYLSLLWPGNWFRHGISAETPAEKAQEEKNKIIDRFEKRLSIDPVGLSTAISIGFESADPLKSARITNTIADEYVEDQLNAKFEATQKATQWLSDRIQKLAQQVQAADAAVQQYKAENNIAETAEGVSVVDQQMASVSAQLVAAKSDLAEKQANYGRVSSLVRSGRAADVSQVVSSPLIATLRGQETDLGRQEADLSTQFGPRHPKIVEIESEKKNLQDKIAEEVQRVVQTVASDVAVAQANVSSLEQSLAELEAKSQDQSKASVRLKALESAASSSRSMYEAYLGKLKETQGQEGIQTPDARLISTAEMPHDPSFPNKPLILTVMLAAASLLGFVFAFAVESMDSGFRTASRVESTLGVPVLATIPEVARTSGQESSNVADQIIDKPMSSFAEAIRGIQLGLSLSNVDSEPKVVIVTSSVPAEGKTTIAISLARQEARGGKRVLLIDGDLRRPMISKSLNLNELKHDICDVLLGTVAIKDALIKDPKSGVQILPCTRVPPSPADLLLSQSMDKLIAQARQDFDSVIVDSAPILPVNDTKILSRHGDAILFVTRWENTHREAARSAIRALQDVKASIAGVALARANTARFQYYNYGYRNYYSYHKYYGN